MMNFRNIKTALVTLLGNEAAGRYRTIGYQKQGQDADKVKDSNRTVQVYYSRARFPQSAGGISGPVKHNMTFRLDLMVSSAAKGDLATLKNPTATPAQIQTALNGFQQAAELADNSMSELIDILYQVIMDAEHVDLDQATYLVSSRWVDDVEVDEPLPRGQVVVLTGSMQFTCSMDEQVSGDPGVAGVEPIHDIETITFQKDSETQEDTGKAGVKI